MTKLRAAELQIDFLVQQTDRICKTGAVENLLRRIKLDWDAVCFVGDNVVDLGPLKRAGFAVAVGDARPEVKAAAHYRHGCVGRARRGARSRGNAFKSAGQMGCDCGALFKDERESQQRAEILYVIAGVALLFAAASAAGAVTVQTTSRTRAISPRSDITPPPNQQKIKSILSGAEALPQPGGVLIIKQLKLETFNLEGKLEVAVMAPECIYDTFKSAANSPGHLQVWTGDGRFRVEGDGFLWRQSESFLTISNNVRTVIEYEAKMNTKP